MSTATTTTTPNPNPASEANTTAIPIPGEIRLTEQKIQEAIEWLTQTKPPAPPPLGSAENPFFDGHNATEHIERFERNYYLEQERRRWVALVVTFLLTLDLPTLVCFAMSEEMGNPPEGRRITGGLQQGIIHRAPRDADVEFMALVAEVLEELGSGGGLLEGRGGEAFEGEITPVARDP